MEFFNSSDFFPQFSLVEKDEGKLGFFSRSDFNENFVLESRNKNIHRNKHVLIFPFFSTCNNQWQIYHFERWANISTTTYVVCIYTRPETTGFLRITEA